MAIREDVVASAAHFLQDPSVSASPVESRIAFLQAKKLTQDEISAALARAAPATPDTTTPAPSSYYAPSSMPPPPAHYGQHSSPYLPHVWQAAPREAPRRDWRDWFIMTTVAGAVGYGLYSLCTRYVYPLVAPPTPERLEQDKKSIDEQFEKMFALVAQLAKDTEALKEAEQARTERLDTAMVDLETVMGDLKSANRRREDDAQRVRDDVQNLKDAIPRALNAQKDATDARLREVNAELKSLKTLISQRLNLGATSNSTSTSTYLSPSSDDATPKSAGAAAPGTEDGNIPTGASGGAAASSATDGSTLAAHGPEATRPSPFSSGSAAHGKASIPSWQLAMASKTAASFSENGSGS